MKKIFQNQRLKKLVLTAKPWIVFLGILFLLKVTGALSGISFITNSVLMKTGVMDIQPQNAISNSQTFSYDFTLKDLDGNKLEMSKLKGKVIFLNLWATWCGPCRVEMPSIQNLYNSIDQEKIAFVMLSLDYEEQHKKVVQFIHDKDFTFPVYVPAGPLPKLLHVNTIPTTFIIGTDGKVKSKKAGTANYDTDEFREFLKELSK
jgi:peroxiredoxin